MIFSYSDTSASWLWGTYTPHCTPGDITGLLLLQWMLLIVNCIVINIADEACGGDQG